MRTRCHDTTYGVVGLEAEMAPISAQTGDPEFAPVFLMQQKPPANSSDLFANISGAPEELYALALLPAGFDGDSVLPPEARLRCRGEVSAAWRQFEAS